MQLITIMVHCHRSDQKMVATVDCSRTVRLLLGAAAAVFGYRGFEELGMVHLGTGQTLDLDHTLEDAGLALGDELGVWAAPPEEGG